MPGIQRLHTNGVCSNSMQNNTERSFPQCRLVQKHKAISDRRIMVLSYIMSVNGRAAVKVRQAWPKVIEVIQGELNIAMVQ